MKIAVLSDVHGNRFALEAVLEDVVLERPELIANLGDQVWGAADPAGAWRLQQELGAASVRGNTDEMAAGTREAPGDTAAYADWVRAQLPQDAPAALAALPLTAELAGGRVLVAHGSLRDAWEPLMLAAAAEVPFAKLPPASPAALAERLAGVEAEVVVVGHTHRELIACLGGITVINAGPVSRPFDGLGAARWLLLEERRGVWSATFRRLPYDASAAARWAEANSPYGAHEARLLGVG